MGFLDDALMHGPEKSATILLFLSKFWVTSNFYLALRTWSSPPVLFPQETILVTVYFCNTVCETRLVMTKGGLFSYGSEGRKLSMEQPHLGRASSYITMKEMTSIT